MSSETASGFCFCLETFFFLFLSLRLSMDTFFVSPPSHQLHIQRDDNSSVRLCKYLIKFHLFWNRPCLFRKLVGAPDCLEVFFSFRVLVNKSYSSLERWPDETSDTTHNMRIYYLHMHALIQWQLNSPADRAVCVILASEYQAVITLRRLKSNRAKVGILAPPLKIFISTVSNDER